MPALLTLTCPNCGGKLTPARTANLLVCLYCGVEHVAADFPVEEAVGPQLRGTISLSLPDGMALPLIASGTRLPTEFTQSFSTVRDNQSRLEIALAVEAQSLSRDNIPIGTFVIEGIPPAPRGVPEIEVCLRIDEREHLTVTASAGSTRTEIIGRADLSGLMADASPGR